MKMKATVILMFFILLFAQYSWAQNVCDSVLANGAFRTSHIKNTYYGKLLLAAKLSRMSKAEAEQATSANINFPIKGIPVGASFSDSQFSNWAERVSSSLDVNQIIRHSTSILLSEGDPTIVNAWRGCLSQNGGVSAYIEPRSDKNPILRVEWIPYPGSSKIPKITDVSILGAKVVGGADSLKVGAVLQPRNEKLITLERIKNEPIIVVINTTIRGAEAYLPKNIELPEVILSRRVKYSYNYGGYPNGYAIVKAPGEYTIYDQPGGGPYGNDVAKCIVTNGGLIEAYNKDSTSPSAVKGGTVSRGCSKALYKSFNGLST